MWRVEIPVEGNRHARVEEVLRELPARGELTGHAKAFLQALAAAQDSRLEDSCEMALAALPFHDRTADPRVLFFPALFAYANCEERQAYLGDHLFTRAIVERWQNAPDTCQLGLKSLSAEARVKVGEAVEALEEVCHLAGLPLPHA